MVHVFWLCTHCGISVMPGNIAVNNFPKASSVLLSFCSECLHVIQNGIFPTGWFGSGTWKVTWWFFQYCSWGGGHKKSLYQKCCLGRHIVLVQNPFVKLKIWTFFFWQTHYCRCSRTWKYNTWLTVSSVPNKPVFLCLRNAVVFCFWVILEDPNLTSNHSPHSRRLHPFNSLAERFKHLTFTATTRQTELQWLVDRKLLNNTFADSPV